MSLNGILTQMEIGSLSLQSDTKVVKLIATWMSIIRVILGMMFNVWIHTKRPRSSSTISSNGKKDPRKESSGGVHTASVVEETVRKESSGGVHTASVVEGLLLKNLKLQQHTLPLPGNRDFVATINQYSEHLKRPYENSKISRYFGLHDSGGGYDNTKLNTIIDKLFHSSVEGGFEEFRNVSCITVIHTQGTKGEND